MPIQIRKGAGALRRKHVWLALLVAGLVLLVMSGCSQAKQAGTRSVSTAADLIAQMADQEVSTSDSPLESGTAAAATHLLKNRSTVVTGEENGLLAQALRDSADAQRYNPRSTPTVNGVVRMARLFLYPGDWSEDEVARAIVTALGEMESELPADNRDKQITTDSYMVYTYSYSVSVRQAYSDQASAWVVGVGINQTAKEEHKT